MTGPAEPVEPSDLQRLEFRILGPLEIRRDDEPVQLPAPRAQAALVVLLLKANRVVSVDELCDELWREQPPRTARSALHVHIAALRRALGPAAPLQTRHPGYLLELDDQQLDALRFELELRGARSARDGESVEAGARLRAALSLWRGPALAEFADLPCAREEAARLEELRLAALEQRIDFDLALGSNKGLIAELRLLAAAHPYRERLQAQLMLALYRAGRQADALQAYQDARTNLVEQLGIEPGAGLRNVHRAILAQDPALGVPPAATTQMEARLPAGIVSFVFTDIEGSTRLLRSLGDAYGELMDLHCALLRATWREHGGRELMTEGDAFVVAFADASSAIAASIDAQRAIAAANWPTTMPVRIRIGIHSGYAHPRGDGYAALALHQAARVVDAAHGGQVLVTGDTRDRAIALPADIRVERLGRFRIRDFDEPPELFRVIAPGIEQRRAAPRVRPAEGHNLVRPLTSFEGREDELSTLVELMRPASAVTIVGAGGAGKTRLAIETALSVADGWDDGAWFVDLAPLPSVEGVPEALANAVGAKSAPGTDPWAGVLDHLRERRALVILDNCEHLGEAIAARVAELLDACPHVGVLATSRAPLDLLAERVYRLGPLPCDDDDSPAVRLFRDRAAVRSERDDANIVSLCAELDGLPLAIELAAARSTAMRPGEILDRLRNSTSVLRSRDPTLPERHRTLDRLLDWSYDLLGARERAVLRRLAVFAASFDLDSAAVACAADDLTPREVPELLWTLTDASLVVTDAAAGTSRYRLLWTVRAYAASRTPSEERAGALRRLADHYIDVLGPPRATAFDWLGAMALELENLRQVMAEIPDHAIAQALAWSIGRYHDLTNRYRAGIEELTHWTQRLTTEGPNRAALLALLADLHLTVGELSRGGELVAEAARVAAITGPAKWDPAGIALAQADLMVRQGDAAGAARQTREALAEPQSDRARAQLQNQLGMALGMLGDFEGAAAAVEEALLAASTAEMQTLLGVLHANLAEAQMRLGDEIRAARNQATALEFARAYSRPTQIALSEMTAAQLAAGRGQFRRAVLLQSAADRLLAGLSFVLYDVDSALRDLLMESARTNLGVEEFDRASGEGHTLDPDTAADLAARVLLDVSRERVEPALAP